MRFDFKAVLFVAIITTTVLFTLDQIIYGRGGSKSSIDSPALSKLPVRVSPKTPKLSRDGNVYHKTTLVKKPFEPQNLAAISASRKALIRELTMNKTHTKPKLNHATTEIPQEEVQQPLVIQESLSSTLPSSQCPASLQSLYRQSEGSSGSDVKDVEWCKRMRDQFGVILGRSWGGLPRQSQKEWDHSKCNELLKVGKRQSCDQRWGWSYFNEWLNSRRTLVSGQSTVTCAADIKTSTFCKYSNVQLDFSKVSIDGSSRGFKLGFLTTYGVVNPDAGDFPPIPGRVHVHIPAGSPHSKQHCDETENRPVFVISNDDIYNLGHYMNDVMTVWHMLTLAKIDSKNAILINFDGIREGGPAGGQPHRLMLPQKPDEHGPFAGYYESWFSKVHKAVDYGSKKVCFKELYFQPFPGVPWFWNDWSAINDCSMLTASPLYQSFNAFFRKRWLETHGPKSLPLPDSGDTVHIVVETRAFKSEKGMASICRYIPNMAELLRELRSLPNVRVTAQNFAEISFEEQVALTHSAGVFVSMHGAGTTHLFHAAIGSPNCCAVVELQPDHTMMFQNSHGHGNQARMLGSHYFRYEAAMGLTSSKGTRIDVKIVKNLVAAAVAKVRTKPSCLHDIRDTSNTTILDAPSL